MKNTSLPDTMLTASALCAGRDQNPALLDAVREFTAVVESDGFPCIFAKRALARDTLLFSHLVWDDPPSRGADLGGLVSDFLRLIAPEPPARAAMMALVVVFDFPGRDDTTSFEPVAWNIVQALMDADPVSAAAAGPVDDPSWALTFERTPLFINISSPEHVRRRSHNLGSRLAFVIQPRAGIDFFAPPNDEGDQIREVIRRRLDAYDAIPRSPDLATHGAPANRDWKQYWISDDPDRRVAACPLRSVSDAPAPMPHG